MYPTSPDRSQPSSFRVSFVLSASPIYPINTCRPWIRTCIYNNSGEKSLNAVIHVRQRYYAIYCVVVTPLHIQCSSATFTRITALLHGHFHPGKVKRHSCFQGKTRLTTAICHENTIPTSPVPESSGLSILSSTPSHARPLDLKRIRSAVVTVVGPKVEQMSMQRHCSSTQKATSLQTSPLLTSVYSTTTILLLSLLYSPVHSLMP